jgi:hypothetical protein
VLVGEARVRLVGLRLLLGRALAHVLDREPGHDHDRLVGAAQPVGLEHHPRQPRVDRQLRQPPPQRREPAAGILGIESAQLVEEVDPVADLRRSGGSRNGKSSIAAEPERRHLQQHGGQARAQDLGVGEARALVEVLLGVEADADAVRRAPAAALALVGRGLRDRLDRQPLDLQRAL